MNYLLKAFFVVHTIVGLVIVPAAQTSVSVDPRNSNPKIANAEPIVVSIDARGRVKLGEQSLSVSSLKRGLDAALDERIPPERIVYIKADSKVPFSQILKLLRLGRAVQQDTFGLILDDKKAFDPNEAVMTKIILEAPSRRSKVEAHPLYLGVTLKKNGKFSLNGEPHTATSLTTELHNIFKSRSENGVYVEGTEEVERTVFLVPSASTTFGAIVQAARIVKEAGAVPIGIEIDPPRPQVIQMTQIGQ